MTQKFLKPTGIEDEDSVILASRTPKKRAGRRVFKETRHPVYRGVRLKNHGKWVCELRNPKTQKRVWLGTYSTLEMAARAHDVAAIAFRGRLACLNFADSAWRLPLPVSMETEDIQKAAAEAGEMFRYGDEECVFDSEVNSSSTVDEECVFDSEGNSSSTVDVDVDDLFSISGEVVVDLDMQRWLINMTDEPLMSPPPQEDFLYNEKLEYGGDADLSLWSYSMY